MSGNLVMMKLFIITCYLFIHSTLLSAYEPNKEPAFIFASSNLQFVFPKILKKFYKIYPDSRVFIQYGSSGYLAKEILKGKHYDIYFAANQEYPQTIYTAKKSVTKPKKYTQGLLILLISRDVALAKEKMNILNSPEIHSITIANQATAPYGVAAMEALRNFHCSEAVLKKVNFKNDIETVIGNVIWNKDAGFISKSALYMMPNDRQEEGVDWIEINHSLYTPIMQYYVVSQRGLQNESAMKFLNFIESEIGQNIFHNNGYKSIQPE